MNVPDMDADLSLPHRPRPLITLTSLGLLALLTLGPLLLEPQRDHLLEPYSSTTATVLAETLVLFLMGLSLWVRIFLDRPSEPRAAKNMALFVVLAACMTAMHWIEVDRDPERREWQQRIYLQQFNGDLEAPHNYRPLPHGFVCLLEHISRDWVFACESYRWFFTVWFLWASYGLARRCLDPPRALLTLAALVFLYPLSILHYGGQLTDPLSHMLFVLSFLFLLEDRVMALAVVLALGVCAKETVVIVAPAYLACYWRRGARAWLFTAALGVVCILAFLAARLPLGWRPSAGSLNGAGLVIAPNFGLEHPYVILGPPLWENLLHPLLFVGMFLPFLVRRWRYIDPKLRALFLVVTPLLLLSNVCFGWLYESRNYIPLVPLLATMAVPPAIQEPQVELEERHKVGT
ncbi:MAG: hypothetical protein ACYC3I_24245 [Gemmataceae bacterium]